MFLLTSAMLSVQVGEAAPSKTELRQKQIVSLMAMPATVYTIDVVQPAVVAYVEVAPVANKTTYFIQKANSLTTEKIAKNDPPLRPGWSCIFTNLYMSKIPGQHDGSNRIRYLS